MSLLKFLQDYPWQCSNTRYYSGLTLTLTGTKINFNLNTLPNPFIYFFFLWVPYWSWTNLNGFADRYLTARSRKQKMSATNDRRMDRKFLWEWRDSNPRSRKATDLLHKTDSNYCLQVFNLLRVSPLRLWPLDHCVVWFNSLLCIQSVPTHHRWRTPKRCLRESKITLPLSTNIILHYI